MSQTGRGSSYRKRLLPNALPVRYARRSRMEHRELLVASGVGEMAADLLLGLDRIFRENALAETTTTVPN